MKLAWILACAVAFVAQPTAAQDAPSDKIMDFQASDTEMNKAIAGAVASLPDFLGHFDKPASDEAEFMVKYDVDRTDGVEYVWAGLVGRSGSSLDGVLINQPEYTKDKLGDRVTIGRGDVIDWGYRKGGVMQGSYTTRVMLARMPEAEAAEYRGFLGW